AKIGKIPNPAQEEQDNIENEILSSEKITENTEQTKENQNDSDTLDSNKNFNKEEKEDK
ncbi:TPA: MotA/TolQ/ExbB proton channel family protein, partial [Campylobacter coli]